MLYWGYVIIFRISSIEVWVLAWTVSPDSDGGGQGVLHGDWAGVHHHHWGRSHCISRGEIKTWVCKYVQNVGHDKGLRSHYRGNIQLWCEEQCSTVEDTQCSTVQDTQCTTQTQEKCTTENERVCNTLNEQQCRAQPEQVKGPFNSPLLLGLVNLEWGVH